MPLHDSDAHVCIRALLRNTAFVKERLRTFEWSCHAVATNQSAMLFVYWMPKVMATVK